MGANPTVEEEIGTHKTMKSVQTGFVYTSKE